MLDSGARHTALLLAVGHRWTQMLDTVIVVVGHAQMDTDVGHSNCCCWTQMLDTVIIVVGHRWTQMLDTVIVVVVGHRWTQMLDTVITKKSAQTSQ